MKFDQNVSNRFKEKLRPACEVGINLYTVQMFILGHFRTTKIYHFFSNVISQLPALMPACVCLLLDLLDRTTVQVKHTQSQ